MSNITTFSSLIEAYPTWEVLSAFLKSEAGGFLRIDDTSATTSPFALIRYVKGKSNLALPHVRAFRSVVWDTLAHRPVSVTPAKSHDGEGLPENTMEFPVSQYRIQEFVDGVMIGMFWDTYTNVWRIHTRSTLGAECRYYSQTKTFKTMFYEVAHGFDTWLPAANSSMSYTFVLQHPENRIVTPVSVPTLYCIQQTHVNAAGVVTSMEPAGGILACPNVRQVTSYPVQTANEIWHTMAIMNHDASAQGLVIKHLITGERYKIRTMLYNAVRQLRGNSPRRDYLWLTLWRQGRLPDYLKVYPEERFLADAVVQTWKTITNSVFHIYTDVFKARSMDKATISPKFRPLVYGLHSLYMESLKPAQKSVDWKTTLEYMNGRDVAQMLFVINWEAREAAKTATAIPLEPASRIGTDFQETLQTKHEAMAED